METPTSAPLSTRDVEAATTGTTLPVFAGRDPQILILAMLIEC